MVDVIKRRITGVSADTVGAKIDMANISPASFSSALAATTSVTAGKTMTLTVTVTAVWSRIPTSGTRITTLSPGQTLLPMRRRPLLPQIQARIKWLFTMRMVILSPAAP